MSDAPVVPPVVGFPLALAAGLAMPVQGRINGALGTVLDDSIAAALISFGTGLILMVAITLVLPGARAGARQIIPSVRERRFPPYYVAAGAIGAFFVFSQSLTIGVLGVALFTVAAVMGQSLSGLLVDRAGIGPGGKRAATPMRVIGVVLTVLSVVWAVSPRFGAAGEMSSWLIPVLLPVAAGVLMSFQQAMNGTASLHYGTPLAATLMNFIAGTVVLVAAWLVKLAIAGPGNHPPSEWWYYLGGPMGCVFIALGALLVRSLGVLLTGLCMIGGQLVGSLLLDLVVPAPGTIVVFATVAGTLLTLAAIILTTLPWPGRPRT
ncbi:DMT family transporter [Arthrobacter sp. NamB2]|uniref:DMT family transporter n=1 Tax=Arthrobacter sp. NamB2 TaxID=2576035 RepID=UPI0010C9357B|nr:DMT family transporter [Arthrobacter sp. NamB2]TKV27895.1 DMT family transporter [Arthrobacter sp. NamB2]